MEKTPTWDFLTVTFCRIDPTETCFNWFPGNLSEEDGKSLEQNGILIPLLLQAVPGKKYRIIDEQVLLKVSGQVWVKLERQFLL